MELELEDSAITQRHYPQTPPAPVLQQDSQPTYVII